jgi:DNA-binding CsgD family transcriptional regulator
VSRPIDISEQAPCLVEDVLSPREREVVRCVAGGMTNAEAARALSISIKTVKAHLANIFAKAGVRSRRELVGYALRVGII